MDPLDRKVLTATASLLKRWVNEEVLPANQRTEAVLAINALELSAARNALDPAFVAALRQREHDLAARLGGRIIDGGTIGSELSSLFATSPQVADNKANAQALRDFLIAWYEPTDPLIEEGPAGIYRPFEAGEDPQANALIITRERMQAYLDRRFPESGTKVAAVEVLRGGYSKGTYIVHTETAGQSGKFVVRQDRPGLPTGSSVVGEYEALLQIFPHCPKAPEPLWAEADECHFGAGVMAVGYRPGEPGRVFPDEPERRRKWAMSTARVIGALHSIRPETPGDVRQFMRETLDSFRARIARAEHAPHPGLAFGMAWLEQHLDDLAGRPACRTHGDLAFHNILMDGDEVSAALDWEFTQFSDPVEDLSYIRPFIVQLGYWDEFMTEYAGMTGFAWDEKAARWFAVFTAVRIVVCNHDILDLLLTTDLNDVALIVAGAKLLQKFEIGLLDAILQD
jgi:aminoglycoside phosphotransferase (APT) family kinase protein